MTDCDHEDIRWDWGDVRPSEEQVIVPGWCPECETELDRVYEHTDIVEA